MYLLWNWLVFGNLCRKSQKDMHKLAREWVRVCVCACRSVSVWKVNTKSFDDLQVSKVCVHNHNFLRACVCVCSHPWRDTLSEICK